MSSGKWRPFCLCRNMLSATYIKIMTWTHYISWLLIILETEDVLLFMIQYNDFPNVVYLTHFQFEQPDGVWLRRHSFSFLGEHLSRKAIVPWALQEGKRWSGPGRKLPGKSLMIVI